MELRCGAFASIKPIDASVDLIADAPPLHFHSATNTYIDTNGCSFRQLFQDWPLLNVLYPFKFENEFNAWSSGFLAQRYMWVGFLLCAAYLIFNIVGTKVMANRTPFKLKRALQLWNLLLSVFSLIGFLRTAPHLLNTVIRDGFYESTCAPAEPSFGHGAAGLWVMLFVVSKAPELIDTVFIVLRKNKLIFLHWYHHVTVLLFCLHSYATRSSAGLYFASMNFGVHALMYFYYFLSASGYKAGWAGLVTTLQISQMFVGMFVCGAVATFKYVHGRQCDMSDDNLLWGGIMYASYAALFIFFAFEKYFTGKSSFDKVKKGEGEGKTEGKTEAAVEKAPAAAVAAAPEAEKQPAAPVARKEAEKEADPAPVSTEEAPVSKGGVRRRGASPGGKKAAAK